MAREFPDVTFEEAMIDTISMKLVMAPQQYDVVVTTNQFGDSLTDIGAGLARPSTNLMRINRKTDLASLTAYPWSELRK